MALPDTRDGLESVGYQYTGEGRCRACGVPLLWFLSPHQKKIPFHIEAGTEDREHRVLVCHFSNCPNAADFRKPKEKK
jgi:hypothetical protein